MTSRINKATAILLIVCFILSITAVAVFAKEDNSNRYVVPENSKYLGKTYEQWSVKWWQWVLAIPGDRNPLYDDGTGKLTTEAQSGDVWFLAGSWNGTQTITINVPAGKALFLPVINVEGSKMEGLGNTYQEMHKYSDSIIDNVTVKKAIIDGNRIDLHDYRVASKLFYFRIPANNDVLTKSGEKITVPPYISPAVSDGYWIMVKPLSVGKHTIYIYGKAINVPGVGVFETEMTYHINVKPKYR